MYLKKSVGLRIAMFGRSGTRWVDTAQAKYPPDNAELAPKYVYTDGVRVDSLMVYNPETQAEEVVRGHQLPPLEFKDGRLDETFELFGHRHRLWGITSGTNVHLSTETHYPTGKSRGPMIVSYGICYSTYKRIEPPKMVITDPQHIMGLALRSRRRS